MDPVTNPYAPGAGTQPPELAGRDEILTLTRNTFARMQSGRPVKNFLLVGLRGVGKTVLLNRIEQIADQNNYIVATVEISETKSLPEILVPPLRRILSRLDTKDKVNAAAKRGLAVLRTFMRALKLKVGEFELGIDIPDEAGTADSGDLDDDLFQLFEAIGEAAQERQRVVALIIDELQFVKEVEFGALLMAMHRISQRRLPVILIGAGLPQLVGLAGRSKSYAERLFDCHWVGALRYEDARLALLEPARREGVTIHEDAIGKIVYLTKGYPYFLQEWGHNTWDVAEGSSITLEDVGRASELTILYLDNSFFRIRFDRLTPRERNYLFAMAALGSGPHRSGDIAAELRLSVERVAPVRSSLAKKGMVFSPAHGYIAFTVPMFEEYLNRRRAVAIHASRSHLAPDHQML